MSPNKASLKAIEDRFKKDYRTQTNNLGEDTRFAKKDSNRYNVVGDSNVQDGKMVRKLEQVGVGWETSNNNGNGEYSKNTNNNRSTQQNTESYRESNKYGWYETEKVYIGERGTKRGEIRQTLERSQERNVNNQVQRLKVV